MFNNEYIPVNSLGMYDNINIHGNLPTNFTERGFCYAEFVDLYDNQCSIQNSSLATQDAVWIGVDNSRMHLNRYQVEMILPILQNFVINGTIDK